MTSMWGKEAEDGVAMVGEGGAGDSEQRIWAGARETKSNGNKNNNIFKHFRKQLGIQKQISNWHGKGKIPIYLGLIQFLYIWERKAYNLWNM